MFTYTYSVPTLPRFMFGDCSGDRRFSQHPKSPYCCELGSCLRSPCYTALAGSDVLDTLDTKSTAPVWNSDGPVLANVEPAQQLAVTIQFFRHYPESPCFILETRWPQSWGFLQAMNMDSLGHAALQSES